MDAIIRSKDVAADSVKAIRKKLIPADNLKQSVENSLLLMIKLMTCAQQLEAAMYSTSAVEVETHVCFLHCHEISLPPRN
ncbi:hypothetical protein L1987_23762 [Smallanthus sonchifolius]|uniref:Uncharacterized protein n=1 Tax=Smallanthus sonchifolius TaxID=185202 RepID=A0ACB9IJ58_9ASTR|nr:hypothetical protein L1987_23762 [Smallanthus sonchifolius]